MSVPMATCTVTGIPRRPAAASRLDSRELRAALVQIARHRLADAEPLRHAVVDGAVQEPAGFVGHPERAGAERLVDVLGGRARQGDLEIVNDGGAVGRDRRHEAALHQVDQDRARDRS